MAVCLLKHETEVWTNELGHMRAVLQVFEPDDENQSNQLGSLQKKKLVLLTWWTDQSPTSVF